MATQTYKTHRHNPKLTAVGFLFLVLSVVGFILSDLGIGGRYTVALGVAGLIASVAVLLSISRIYITRLQDRIIKLEMRVRALSVLTPAQRETLARLKKAQLVALRFASDEELGGRRTCRARTAEGSRSAGLSAPRFGGPEWAALR
jgi:hypothetical protein